MNWSISWKNIWRNKLRSLVVIIAVSLGLIAGVFSGGLMNGVVQQRINSALDNEVSHLQIYNEKYLQNNEIKHTVKNTYKLIADIKNISDVEAVSERIVISAMVNTASSSTGLMLNGIHPERERSVSKLYEAVLDSQGTYFENTKRNPIFISKKLAEKLKVKVRSKIVVTMQDMSGDLTGAAFRVCGIFKTNNSMFDEMNAFVKYDDLQRLSLFPDNQAHEIAVKLNETEKTATVKEKIKSLASDYTVQDWKELSPDVGMMVDFMDLYMYIFVIIILFALGFGLVNTMLMVVLERTKELGMLMAVGMNKFRIFKMIMTETILLSFTGGIVGVTLGAALISIFGNVGIDLSSYGEGFEAIGYASVIYPKVSVDYYFGVTALVVITGIIASIYPARKALKLNPAEAVRSDN